MLGDSYHATVVGIDPSLRMLAQRAPPADGTAHFIAAHAGRWEPEAWIWCFLGDYFFADLCSGWIRRFDPASGVVTDFASGFSAPVDLHVGADGGLYVLSRGAGAVHVIRFGGI